MTDNSFMYGARSTTRVHEVLQYPEVEGALHDMVKREMREELERDYRNLEIHNWEVEVREHQLPEPTLWFGTTVDRLATTTVVVFYAGERVK